jgi:hypothetical protein
MGSMLNLKKKMKNKGDDDKMELEDLWVENDFNWDIRLINLIDLIVSTSFKQCHSHTRHQLGHQLDHHHHRRKYEHEDAK